MFGGAGERGYQQRSLHVDMKSFELRAWMGWIGMGRIAGHARATRRRGLGEGNSSTGSPFAFGYRNLLIYIVIQCRNHQVEVRREVELVVCAALTR